MAGEISDWVSPNLSVIANENPADNDGNSNATDGVDGGPTNVLVNNCSLPTPFWEQDQNTLNIVTASICGLYFMFGIVCTFVGYRYECLSYKKDKA